MTLQLAPKQLELNILGGALIGVAIGEQVAVNVERHLDRAVPHELFGCAWRSCRSQSIGRRKHGVGRASRTLPPGSFWASHRLLKRHYRWRP